MTFTGDFQAGDSIFVKIGNDLCGKTFLLGEPNASIARHFAFLINGRYVGVRAECEDDVLRLFPRSTAKAFRYPFTAWVVRGGVESTGDLTISGDLKSGLAGTWEVDPTAEMTLNRAARDWHTDFYVLCQEKELRVTTAVSMELVNPPAAFAARFPDGSAVTTSTGFGDLHSTHCTFNASMQAFQSRVFMELSNLMAGVGLTPRLQFGEFCWWYFTNWSPDNPAGGMAYWDAETAAAAVASLGRPLYKFLKPADDPSANAFADATFLQQRLCDYVGTLAGHLRSAFPDIDLEVLFPYDVNHPIPSGIHLLGGALNRFVNLPIDWEKKETSGLDRFKIEALDFGAWNRNLDLVRACQEFPISLGWPATSVSAMVPVFRCGYPWGKEVSNGLDLGFTEMHLWAFDHICLYGWSLGPRRLRQARRLA